jgi:hypothetical protein
MSQTKVAEKIKIHLCSETFLIVPFEKMWKNIVEPDRPRMTDNTVRAHCMLDT